ncbi:acetoacetate decarboxylase family protein [Dyella telluris]|uniref:acetoacetate decarboxylase family protein n=1 Tax=Dyella telluris TaxID=2763498 RepID=UPI001C9ADC0B|nr:acetoacetate decarboxylase family protein [Dyella telluris]
MAAPSHPPFLYPPGSPLMHPPLALTQARMYGFWVPGDAKALQASVDATLNAGAGGNMAFTVVSPYVLMTFTDIARAYSQWPDDRAKGWGREVDIVAWVLVAGLAKGEWLPSFYAYPLHIWVDDCMALIVGREVFGYPKYLCSHFMPGPDEPPVAFTLAAKGFQPFSPDSELCVHPLLEVTGAPLLGTGRPIGDVQVWRNDLLGGLDERPDFWSADPSWRSAFDQWFLTFPAMPQIFLKQFPDATGQQAVYQAIVAANAQVQAIHGVWMLGQEYSLNLHEFASFPLARTLGWSLGEQKAWFGYRIDFDFHVEAGVELVNNTLGTEAR